MRKTFLSLAMLILCGSAAAAQDGPPAGDLEQKRPRANMRRDLFRQLGLSRVQMGQIGQLNRRRRPLIEGAQRHFREANRRLDDAIYSDQLNEADVENRLKDVQFSQGELIRIRSMNELSIRKILTPDQLVRFRRMRQRFDAISEGRGRQALIDFDSVNKDRDRNK